MLVLPAVDGQALPANAQELERAIDDSLDEIFVLPAGHEVVAVRPGSDGGYPSLESIRIDLSDAEVDLESLPPAPKPTGQATQGPTAGRFEIIGHPIRHRGAGLDLDLTARDVEFEFKRGRDRRPLLLMKHAREGHVEVRVRRADLDEILLEAAKEAAAPHGVTIVDVKTDLAQEDPAIPALRAAVQVTARKFLTAVIVARGRLEVDEAFNAVTSDLECEGQGMLGSLVCGLLKPHLQKLNNRKFSIAALPLGDVQLHDVALKLDNKQLRIAADFGE